MALRLLWKPNFREYFLVYEGFNQIESLTCSICKSRIVGKKIKSRILFQESNIEIPEDLFNLSKGDTKLSSKELDLPLQANEWAIPLAKNHKIEKITAENIWNLFQKSIPTLLKEANRDLKSEYKHVYCFTLLNHPGVGTLFHPQIRCLSFKHKILVPYWAKNNDSQCPLCHEIKKLNENEVIFAGRNVLAYIPDKALTKGEIIITTRSHRSIQNTSKRLVNELLKALQVSFLRASEDKGESEYIYTSYDFLPKNHIYIRIVKVDYGIKVEYQITRLLSDRSIRLLFSNE